MKLRLPIAVGLLTILAVSIAYGQSASRVMARVKLSSKFMLLKKEMPAGNYEIMKTAGSPSDLAVRNTDTGNTVHVTVVERLARLSGASDKGRFVFNTVGDQRFLSEFWPAGNEDGYLLDVTKAEHHHEIVK
jgi:hypothetical protein